jgi:Zn-dependent protease
VTETPCTPEEFDQAEEQGQPTTIKYVFQGPQPHRPLLVQVVFPGESEIREFPSMELARAREMSPWAKAHRWDRLTEILFQILLWVFCPLWGPVWLIHLGLDKLKLSKKVAKLSNQFPAIGKLFGILVLLAKAGVKGKTVLSMLFAVGVYTWFWGFPFAFGFVLLLFCHEMGHWYVIRRMGFKAGAPVFIPFVGALIAMKDKLTNAWDGAMLGFGGPLVGTVASLVVLILSNYLDSMFLQGLASTGFLINLFNLLPLGQMDGGHITKAISKWFMVAGLVLGGIATWYYKSGILFLLLVLAFTEVFDLFVSKKSKKERAAKESYFNIPTWQRVLVAAIYFALVGFLVFALEVTQVPIEALVK